ncbi:hypothetical protein C1646_471451 [Rhizophagus diaphanus]|nr:hypothetical protein C1646_471451 [Rhizophagus diaphanus] [Rhizophagus sp. MUCL 43196]
MVFFAAISSPFSKKFVLTMYLWRLFTYAYTFLFRIFPGYLFGLHPGIFLISSERRYLIVVCPSVESLLSLLIALFWYDLKHSGRD